MKLKKANFGFTLIEMLIVIAIIGILFSLGFAMYYRFNRAQKVEQAVLELKTELTHARERALSGMKLCEGTFDGILVEFRDESGIPSEDYYKISASCDEGADFRQIGRIYQYSSGVKKKEGPEEILFAVLTGETDLVGPTIISLEGFGRSKSLRVTLSGKIEMVIEE